MGCDGGTIPKRDELVKLKKRQREGDRAELSRIKWSSCAISKEPLREPIVACRLGFLFNKEALLTHFLNKTIPEEFSHIKNIKKDVFPVHFTLLDTKFICPVSRKEIGSARYKFILIRNCGCVVLQSTWKQIVGAESSQTACIACATECNVDDVILLNPEKEELEKQKEKLHTLQLKVKKDKKEKKEKKKEKRRAKKLKSHQLDNKNGKQEVEEDVDEPSTTTATSSNSSSSSSSNNSDVVPNKRKRLDTNKSNRKRQKKGAQQHTSSSVLSKAKKGVADNKEKYGATYSNLFIDPNNDQSDSNETFIARNLSLGGTRARC